MGNSETKTYTLYCTVHGTVISLPFTLMFLVWSSHVHLLEGARGISTLTVVNVSRNGRGALYKPLKLLTLKTRKIHLNRPFKVIHSLHPVTDMPYVQ